MIATLPETTSVNEKILLIKDFLTLNKTISIGINLQILRYLAQGFSQCSVKFRGLVFN
ncbi:MAG: hypothetical protein FD167_1699 [bacterium]|nr:MAG: hypothetical protein FD167_1699 [bacterium]